MGKHDQAQELLNKNLDLMQNKEEALKSQVAEKEEFWSDNGDL